MQFRLLAMMTTGRARSVLRVATALTAMVLGPTTATATVWTVDPDGMGDALTSPTDSRWRRPATRSRLLAGTYAESNLRLRCRHPAPQRIRVPGVRHDRRAADGPAHPGHGHDSPSRASFRGRLGHARGSVAGGRLDPLVPGGCP